MLPLWGSSTPSAGRSSAHLRSQTSRSRMPVENQQIRPRVDRVFPLSETDQALDHLGSGAQMGKVVVQIGDDD